MPKPLPHPTILTRTRKTRYAGTKQFALKNSYPQIIMKFGFLDALKKMAINGAINIISGKEKLKILPRQELSEIGL